MSLNSLNKLRRHAKSLKKEIRNSSLNWNFKTKTHFSRYPSVSLSLADSLAKPISDSAVMDPAQNTSAAGIGGSNGTTTMGYQTNDGTATASEDSKENLNQVINSIQKTLGLLHQLHLTVSSFTPASQLHLLQRLNSLVSELNSMTKLSEKCNIQVPMEVLSLIDDGKNPDEFTRDVINSCVARNQVTKGKTDAFKDLRKHILEELEETFPDEVDKYREIRAASAAEAKRQVQSQSVLPNGDAKVKSEL
ncbi:BnaC07g12340D [Brassica napus]|uniref:Mediator of RNA polymerase II transcription subunit 10 n=1 Tax=Brassica napus TaxID=3708 RepID=A0A078G6H6_BRANA|nr:BnaC07g12340D [Brassica napus]